MVEEIASGVSKMDENEKAELRDKIKYQFEADRREGNDFGYDDQFYMLDYLEYMANDEFPRTTGSWETRPLSDHYKACYEMGYEDARGDYPFIHKLVGV